MLDAALVLANVPFCISGGIVTVWLRGIHFSVPAVVHGAGTQFRGCAT